MNESPVGNGRIAQLTSQLDQAFDRRSWHGTNLRGSLRGVTPEQAAWRPARGRHNIWELAVHAAYWKYAVWRRLAGQARGSFPLKGSNWFQRPDRADEAAWRADLALLARMHQQLREAVSVVPVGSLNRVPPGSTVSTFDLIAGIIAHDLYHAGQIQLLKRLQSNSEG
jgi:hypothetical protein